MSARKDRSKRSKPARPTDYVMEVVQDLTCPICLEFYTYPIILPCSHVLCRRPCAENIFEINFIRCPVCRDNCYITGGITSLPRVIPLESIIEKVRAERKKRAGLRKSASAAPHQANVSSDSVPSSGCDTFREASSSSFSSTSATENFERSAAPPEPSPWAGVPGPRESRGLRVASASCDELLNDYQRIMRSLDNPPNVSGLLRSRIRERNETTTHNDQASSNPTPASATNSWSVATASNSVATNRVSDSPFSATPTNDVTAESTIIVDQEIEDIFCAPGLRNSSLGLPAPSQSTPRAPNLNTLSTISSITCFPNNAGTHSSQEEEVRNVQRSIQQSNTSSGQTAQSDTYQDANTTLCDLDSSNRTDSTVYTPEALAMKHEIQDELAKLSDVQCRLLLYLTSYRDSAQRVQGCLLQDRCEVTSQLDSLLVEIESQRNTLEEGVNCAQRDVIVEVDDVTAATEKLLASTQRLATFADQALSAPPDVLQQTGPAVLEKLSSSVKTCELCLQTSEPCLRAILTSGRYRVDFRRQRQVLRTLSFLKVPRPPVIDLRKCSRSHDTVMLVLAPPSTRDVVDNFQISYCSEEQKYLGIEETVTYNLLSPEGEETPSGPDALSPRGQTTLTFVLIEHLCSSTRYYFRASAVNRAGQSVHGDLVQCMTLCKDECVVPVPSILENLSQPASSTSATIACHSPVTVSPHQGVAHFLLSRPVGGACVWQGEEFKQGGEEHTVTGLKAGEEYQFLVLACNVRGEGQVSEKLSLVLDGEQR